MKSSKLKKLGLFLVAAAFTMVMAFNFQSALISSELVSGISLDELVNVAVAQEEEEGETAYCDTLIEPTYSNYVTCNGVYDYLTWRRDFDCVEEGSGGTQPHCWEGYLINSRSTSGYGSNCYFTNWSTTTHAATAYEC